MILYDKYIMASYDMIYDNGCIILKLKIKKYTCHRNQYLTYDQVNYKKIKPLLRKSKRILLFKK